MLKLLCAVRAGDVIKKGQKKMQNRSNKKLIAGIVMAVAILAVGIMAVVADRAPVPVSSSESKEEIIWDEPEETSSSSAESAPESESAAESVPEEEPDSALEEENALSEEVFSSEAASESASSSKEESSSSSSASSSSSSASSTASSAAHSQAASSHETASSSHAASSSAASSSASAESAVDKQIDSYVSQLTNLRESSQKELYGIIGETYTEYISHPEEERSIALKVSIVVSKTAKLNSAQSRCDKEFNAILKELRQYLKDNGRDQSIADEAEATYKQQKSAMTKEMTDIVYNSATGSGDGGSWIVDHIPS